MQVCGFWVRILTLIWNDKVRIWKVFHPGGSAREFSQPCESILIHKSCIQTRKDKSRSKNLQTYLQLLLVWVIIFESLHGGMSILKSKRPKGQFYGKNRIPRIWHSKFVCCFWQIGCLHIGQKDQFWNILTILYVQSRFKGL